MPTPPDAAEIGGVTESEPGGVDPPISSSAASNISGALMFIRGSACQPSPVCDRNARSAHCCCRYASSTGLLVQLKSQPAICATMSGVRPFGAGQGVRTEAIV
jgi:hypothetical protein